MNVVCGLAYKAPLYGRRTAQIKLLPFDFGETCRYLSNMSGEDKALMYGVVGGTPQYLRQISDKFSVEDNIKNTYLNPTSFLFEEPMNLLKQEVREPGIYTAIITAIATGSSRMSEISRKSIYSIADNMFRFWYRFVLGNNSVIIRGATDLVYKKIQPNFTDYMGKVFEDICMQYLWKLLLSGQSPVEFSALGRWWGNDPLTRSQIEIDIMGEQDLFISKGAALSFLQIGIYQAAAL